MIFIKTSSWLLLPLVGAIAADVGCHDSCPPIHIFGARGTNELPGYGFLAGGFVNETLRAFPGATAEPIVYPADGDPTTALSTFMASVRAGVRNVTMQVTEFAERCPETQLVLVGYSQGAHIMDDALCGGGDPQMGITNTSATIAQFNIKAVLLPGDDRFTVGEPFHVGNATKPGLYPRPSDQLRCGKYTDAIQLYCDANDKYCASGSSLLVHLSYYLRYKDTALEFLKSRLETPFHQERQSTTNASERD